MRKEDPEVRFWRFVDRGGPNDCWLWQGGTVRGYGQFAVTSRDRRYAHRFAWTLTRGPIPDGLTIDHLCRTTRCVNPAHMEPVTAAENSKRAHGWPDSSACRRGHPRTEENEYVPPGKRGRLCRPCQAENRARYEREVRGPARRAARVGHESG